MLSLVFIMSSHAMEKGVFKPPSMEGYTKYWETDMDINKNGIKETHVVIYRNADTDNITSLSTNGRIWAWKVKSHNYPVDKDDFSKNYVIRDSSCSSPSKFNEKYTLDEMFKLPVNLCK